MKRRQRGSSTKWLATHLVGADPDECLIWPHLTNDSGYGILSIRGRTYRAHRVVWEMWNDQQATPGMVVMHSCDNRPCVNPYHLSLGTLADNMADCVAKNRHAKGERQGSAKLTVAEVLAIRETPGRLREIADKYGVGLMTISEIRRGVRWAWLTAPGNQATTSTKEHSNAH